MKQDRIRDHNINTVILQVVAAEEYGARFTPFRIRHITQQVIETLQGLGQFDFANQVEASNYIYKKAYVLLRFKRESIRFRQILRHFPESVILVDDTRRSRGNTILMNHIHTIQNPTSSSIVEYFTNNEFWFVSIHDECVVPSARAISFVERLLHDFRRRRM